jgi:putative photosynthetic complex assembly protein 2
MSEFAAPAAYAVLLWWFTTGIILFLDGLPQATFRWSMTAATAVLLGAIYVLRASAADASVGAAYTAFSCAILVWGWLEMSFLMGFITGPRKHACFERCGGWRHFVHAAQAILYNEIATLAAACGVLAATWTAPNRVALGTFLVLWAMRISAKLNLYFGVPNLGEKFLPAHLQYLKGFFRKRAMNFLFPVSVSGSTVVLVLLAQRYRAANDPFLGTAYALVISLLALALLEHWFMVLPLPSEKLWKWALRSGRVPPGAGSSSPQARADLSKQRLDAAQSGEQLAEVAFVALPEFAEPPRGRRHQP